MIPITKRGVTYLTRYLSYMYYIRQNRVRVGHYATLSLIMLHYTCTINFCSKSGCGCNQGPEKPQEGSNESPMEAYRRPSNGERRLSIKDLGKEIIRKGSKLAQSVQCTIGQIYLPRTRETRGGQQATERRRAEVELQGRQGNNLAK